MTDTPSIYDDMAERGERGRLLDKLAELPREERTKSKFEETARTLDLSIADLRAAIKEREGNCSGREQGAALVSDPEPWPEPVDGAELLDSLAGAARRHIVLPRYADVAIALWVVHTYAHDEAEHSPILAFSSPDKRSGKTTALNFLNQVVRRALPGANITPAALFRAVEKWQPTLLIDEADTFLRGHEELRGVLNSGHAKASAFVIRTVGDDHEPQTFTTWAPKAVALIGTPPSTVVDRSVVIPMRRKRADEAVSRLRHQDSRLAPLGKQCARWVEDAHLGDAEPQVPEALHDRAADNWRPLLAIADAAGGHWPDYARQAATALSASEEDDSAGSQLLADLRDLFAEQPRWSSADVVDRLVSMEDRPWPEWKNGKPLTQRQLAKLLENYGIRPGTVRVGTRTAKGYRAEQFQDAFSRYLPDRSVTPSQRRDEAPSTQSGSVTTGKPVTDSSMPEPAATPEGDGVTDHYREAGDMERI